MNKYLSFLLVFLFLVSPVFAAKKGKKTPNAKEVIENPISRLSFPPNIGMINVVKSSYKVQKTTLKGDKLTFFLEAESSGNAAFPVRPMRRSAGIRRKQRSFW